AAPPAAIDATTTAARTRFISSRSYVSPAPGETWGPGTHVSRPGRLAHVRGRLQPVALAHPLERRFEAVLVLDPRVDPAVAADVAGLRDARQLQRHLALLAGQLQRDRDRWAVAEDREHRAAAADLEDVGVGAEGMVLARLGKRERELADAAGRVHRPPRTR